MDSPPQKLLTKLTVNNSEKVSIDMYKNNLSITSDIFHLYQTGTNKDQKVLMYCYVNANGPRNTFKQDSKMYYCVKS